MSISLKKVFASLPRTERGKFIVLGGDPKLKHYLYVNGNSVIIRNIDDDADSDVYTEHSTQTTVAKYSPSGFYIASADNHGKVRIWDTTQKEHILKNEYQPFAGPVRDLAWSGDNQRICVGGEGREKFGAVFNMETGTSTGEIMGMSRPINALDFRNDRPFRLATASEDNAVCFFEGPPFKFKSLHHTHTNFANALRFSPSGEFFVSGGADGNLFLYDGKTGELLHKIGDPAHKGGIYAVSFSPNSQRVVSVSGDKTVKVWTVSREATTLEQEYVFTNSTDNLLVGCLWLGEHIIVVNLKGHVHIFKGTDVTSGPSRVLAGHNKPITGLVYWPEGPGHLISCSMDSNVVLWDVNGHGRARLLQRGEQVGHSNQVDSMDICGHDLVSVGVDDNLVASSLASETIQSQVKLPSQPRGVNVVNGLVAVACWKHIVLYRIGQGILSTFDVKDFEPNKIALTKDQKFVIVGSKEDNFLRVFQIINSEKLQPTDIKIELRGNTTYLSISPNGRYLAAADSDRQIRAFEILSDGNLKQVHNETWRYHAARVNYLAWSPNSERVASGSVDCAIYVWNVNQPIKKIHMPNAHPANQITGLAWRDDETLFSSGQDCNIRQWHVTQ
jgi:WD40 repeat protein